MDPLVAVIRDLLASADHLLAMVGDSRTIPSSPEDSSGELEALRFKVAQLEGELAKLKETPNG